MNIIKGGIFHLPNGKIMKNGMLIYKNEKIVYCGKIKNIKENVKNELKLKDNIHVTTGIIDCHSHIGLSEEKVESAGNDTNETTAPITAEMRALDGINPFDPAFEYARSCGVTTLNILPGSANPIGGLGVSVKTYGKLVDEMAILSPSSIKMAFGQNPKNVHGSQNKSPKTRMATAALIRQAFYNAIEYKNKKKKDKKLKKDLKLESLNLLLDKKIPARVHSHRTDDIMTAIRISKEFKFDIVLDHVTEGHIIPEVFKGMNTVVGPTLTVRYKDEVKNRHFCTPGVLYENGANVAITTDHPVVPIHQLLTLVMLAVKAGLPKEKALLTITENPAKILKLDKKIGKLAKGFDADIVIWSDDPLKISTNVLKTFINGKQVYEYGKHSSPYTN